MSGATWNTDAFIPLFLLPVGSGVASLPGTVYLVESHALEFGRKQHDWVFSLIY